MAHEVRLFSAQDVLYLQCSVCEHVLSWIQHKPDDSFDASCCEHVYRAWPIATNPLRFRILYGEADETNVVWMPRRRG